MNEELTTRLYSDFPQIYCGHTKPAGESSMCCGFQCEDGWYDIIRELSQQLTDYANINLDKNIEVFQVKQKYGSLRVTLTENSDAADEIIDRAKTRALSTCERSGQPGVLCVNASIATKRRMAWHLKVLSETQANLLGYIPYISALDRAASLPAEGTDGST